MVQMKGLEILLADAANHTKTFFFHISLLASILRYLGLTKSWCIDRKKYEDKEKA